MRIFEDRLKNETIYTVNGEINTHTVVVTKSKFHLETHDLTDNQKKSFINPADMKQYIKEKFKVHLKEETVITKLTY